MFVVIDAAAAAAIVRNRATTSDGRFCASTALIRHRWRAMRS